MITVGKLLPDSQGPRKKTGIALFCALSAALQCGVFVAATASLAPHPSEWTRKGLDDTTTFLRKNSPNILLHKIVSRFRPQLTTPAESLLPPVSLDELKANLPIYTPNLDRAYYAIKADTFSSVWLKNGGTQEELAQVLGSLAEKKIPVPSIRVSQPIQVNRDTDGSILSMTVRIKEGIVLEITRGLGAVFSVKKAAEEIVERERIVSGTIYSSFIEAAQRTGLPLSMVDDFVDLFGDRVEFRKDLQPGDTFAIIFSQKQASDGTWLSTGDIRAASLNNAGKLKAIIRYKSKSGSYQSFDESGKPLGAYFLRYPVQFTRVSSVFSDSRLHPVLRTRRPHNGVDFAAPLGTPVRAVADGVIEAAGYAGGGGNTVKIAHNSRYSTAYLHLHKISPGLKKGARVQRGQIIGTVGMTGLATGPHLHFSLYEGGKYVDPLKTKLPNVLGDRDLAPPQYVQTALTTLKRHLDTVAVAANNQRPQRG